MVRKPDDVMYKERLRELSLNQKKVKRKSHYFNYQMGRRSIEKTEPHTFWRRSAAGERATNKLWQE